MQTRRSAQELEILAVIAQALNRSADVPAALEQTLRLTAQLLACESGWIWLRDTTSKKFYLAASHNLPPFLREPVRMTGTKCWCIESLLDGDFQSQNVDAIECSRLRPAVLRNQLALTGGLAYHASVAIRFGERDLGLMNLTKPGLRRIAGHDLRLLTTIADQLGIAVERARLAEAAMQIARMREREELARDLHDTFAQDLTAITLQLETALQYLDGGERGEKQIAAALEIARASVNRARESVEALQSSSEESSPVDVAIAQLARTFTSQSGIPVHVRVEVRGAHPDLERIVYRIAQEALTNVHRHAKARSVWVSATRGSGRIVLTIRDDGIGWSRASVPGLGIAGMRQRAEQIGGTLTVAAYRGGGTIVRAVLPAAPA